MSKTRLFIIIFLIATALTACSLLPQGTPEPADELAATPVEETTVEPTSQAVNTSGEESTAEESSASEEEAGEVDVTQTGVFGDGWEKISCDTFGVVPELAGIADCGYVTVPENRTTDSDATIQLAVVRVRSTSDNTGAPLFKGTGGPGSDGLAYATYGIMTTEAYGGILEDRDWVYFSQRGTYHAKPDLTCPEYDEIPLNAALKNWSAEELQAQKIERLQKCYDDYVAQGVDFSAYNSNENAADVDDIRQVLGYDKIIWYGQSYGTMLGQYIMRSHPDILEAVILDGVAPVSYEKWTDWNDYPGGFQRVFDACAADEACSAAYPDPAGALADAYATLEKTPQSLMIEQGDILIDGDIVMDALYGKIDDLPKIAYQLQAQDYTVLSTLITESLTPGGPRYLMHYAMACSDDPVASMDEVDTDVPELYKFLTTNDADNYITGCPIIDVPHLPDTSDELVVSDIPTLLLNGALDVATPAYLAHELEAGLPNSYYVLFPTTGHVQERTHCALDIMDAFMMNPLEEPDIGCIEQQVPFVVPIQAAVSSEDGNATLEIMLPAGLFVATEQAGTWAVTDNTASITLNAFPAGTSANDALNDFITNLPVAVENLEIVDGEAIHGYPTRVIQTEVETQGVTVGLDVVAFENEAGAYRIIWQTNMTNLIDPYRALLPNLYQAVTVSEEAAAPDASATGHSRFSHNTVTGIC